MLEDIRNRAYTRLQQALADGDEKKAEAFDSLYEALKDDDYLIKNRLITRLVLSALGYDGKEINQVIDYLVHKDDIKVLLEFVDAFRKFMQVETIINPKIEECYILEHTVIFKYNSFLDSYYRLQGDEWAHDCTLGNVVCDLRFSYEPLDWKSTI